MLFALVGVSLYAVWVVAWCQTALLKVDWSTC